MSYKIYVICVCLRIVVLCFCFVCLRLVFCVPNMLSGSPDCPFLIVLSVFSNVYLQYCRQSGIFLFFILFLQKEIREHDQQLARQFLQIYKDIQQTKVRKSCIQHQEHLDALFDDTEVEKETPNMCDKPVKLRAKTLTCGVTRMNIRSQRFSCS